MQREQEAQPLGTAPMPRRLATRHAVDNPPPHRQSFYPPTDRMAIRVMGLTDQRCAVGTTLHLRRKRE